MQFIKIHFFIFTVICLQFADICAQIQNSIIPAMEQIENIENLSIKKFSQTQYQEICDTLAQKDQRVRIATFNMLFPLYDATLDPINRWPQRFPRVVEAVMDMNADIIGTQELLQHQVNELMEKLGETYAFYAKPDDKYEMPGILYRKDRFEVVDSHVWKMPSTTGDSHEYILTLLILKDLNTDKIIALFNTHLAFSNINARDIQARFIADIVETYSQDYPTILTGDLNTFPHRRDLENLPFYDGDYIVRILTKGCLSDAKDVSILGHLGPMSTFTNEGQDPTAFKGIGTPGVFLDHIFVTNALTVLVHAVQPVQIDGNFPSDHMPIVVDLIVN